MKDVDPTAEVNALHLDLSTFGVRTEYQDFGSVDE